MSKLDSFCINTSLITKTLLHELDNFFIVLVINKLTIRVLVE